MKKILYTMLVALAATLSFTSCEDVPTPYNIPTGGGTGGGDVTLDTEGAGTEESPFTIADLLSGKAKGSNIYVKGYIVGFVPDKAIAETKFTAEGCEQETNIVIAASADETDYTKVVPVQLPAGDIRTSLNLKANPGLLKQEVILAGNIEKYFGLEGAVKGTAWAKIGDKEFGKRPADVVITGTPKGTGTKEDPFNIAAANKYIKDGGAADVEVYVKGIISELKQYKEQYGSIDYYVSDDGKKDNQFYVYGGLSFNGTKFTKLDELKVGDVVIICGKLKKYNSTYELDVKNYIYSLNGKTEAGSTPDTPDTPATPELKAGLNLDTTNGLVTFVNDGVAEGKTATYVVEELGLENAKEVAELALSDGTKLTFGADEGTKKTAYYESQKSIRMYKNNTMHIAGKSKIAKIVFTCDSKATVGNATATLSFDGNNIDYKNVFDEASGKGNVQFQFTKIAITYAK